MKFKLLISLLVALFCAGSANAALIHLEGDIEYHNDVVVLSFTLNQDANNVRVWTDSYLGGTNFDPITALWKADGSFISQSDDDPSINPATQTSFDAGFNVSFLAAGDYTFTVATYNNWALGTMLTDGFLFDNQTSIALAQWTQPANGADMGTHWSVWMDGVDGATDPSTGPSSIPEPSSALLMMLGVFGLVARKKLS